MYIKKSILNIEPTTIILTSYSKQKKIKIKETKNILIEKKNYKDLTYLLDTFTASQ